MDDVVSRQTVKRQMIKYGFHAPDMTVTEFVEDLSSVNSQKSKTEPRYCDRNICLRNEYNSIGCNECEVTKSQESNTVIGTGDGAYYRIKALQAQADGDLTTALCSLPKIQSSDGQEYVQLYDVLELCKATGLAIDKIANDTGINQNYVAEMFMQTMRMILNNMKGK